MKYFLGLDSRSNPITKTKRKEHKINIVVAIFQVKMSIVIPFSL